MKRIGFASQQAVIRSLTTGNAFESVVRILLEVGLIRNEGAHGGYRALDEDALRDCSAVLLQGALLIWMNARVRPLI